MTTLREAAQQALEALGCIEYGINGIEYGPSDDTTESAITALRAALAQQEQEPTVRYKCTVVDDQHPNGVPFERWVNAPQQDEPKGGGNLPPPLQAEPVQDQDDILRMAREAGLQQRHTPPTEWWCWEGSIERFAALVAAAEREKLAHWMRSMGYATGHGDTIEDLLDHLGTRIAEGLEVEALTEREACAKGREEMQ